MRTHPATVLPLALALTALPLNLFLLQSANAATWITNGPMATARVLHTATLLPSGKVLVAGGLIGGTATNSAELYDPATGTWSATTPLNTGRLQHTATLLSSGKVLVSGGATGKPPNHRYLASAELYDPATGTWMPTGAMHSNRCAHTATLLVGGQVLVAGGYYDDPVGGSLYLDSAETYDPATGTWRVATHALNTGRAGHTATLLPDGKVLVVGGGNSSGHLSSTELFDPAHEIWAPIGPLNTARYYHTAALLPNGKVLVAGGQDTNYPSDHCLSSAELYDPVAGTWAPTGPLNTAREFHSTTLLPGGQLLIVGGVGRSGFLSSAELYDPVSGTWTTANMLTFARRSHTATLLTGGQVLVAGGLTTNVVSLSSTELYDSTNGTWTNTAAMTNERVAHAATLLPNGKVLVAGGVSVLNRPRREAELYDPENGSWSEAGVLNISRSSPTVTLLPNGKALVAGGFSANIAQSLSSAELFDPLAGTWSETGALSTGRLSHTATLLRNGKVLVAAGYNAAASSALASAELYDSAAGTWTETGALNARRTYHTATLLTDGKVLVAGGSYHQEANFVSPPPELYDPASGIWTLTGPLTLPRDQHTATLLPNGKVLVAGGFDGTHVLSTVELYDPVGQTWSSTHPMTTTRYYHTATLLPNGMVLVAGGNDGVSWPAGPYLSSAELYDPATETWTASTSLAEARQYHTATLLPSGKVLLAGGFVETADMIGPLFSAELYDAGRGFNSAWQPQIADVNSPLCLGDSLALSGSGFRGVSGGSGGNTQDSSTDYPLVQLRSIESGQTTFLLATNWSANSFTSLPVWNFPPGWAMATVFVNGIPSTSSILNITVPVPTDTTLTDAKTLTNGAFQFSFTNSVGALFGVLATTNPASSPSNWTALGGVMELAPGQFQFTDPQATNFPQRYYRLRSP